ncbi:M20/M25/M40 family metallo-hydrolase [soil metagenome]
MVAAPASHHHSAHALPAAIAALVILGALLMLGLRPPSAKPASAPADEFSAARAIAVLEGLLAEGVPHPVGTPANVVVRDRIIAELESHGYDVHVQQAFACRAAGGVCAHVENLATRLAGRGTEPLRGGTEPPRGGPEPPRGGNRAVMLTSHYDSRGAGPGAADAGASVAAILEVARIIRSEAPFINDVILLITDGEEAGLLGAEAFVAEHAWAADVGVVINLEARGTAGPSIMFETSENNRWLVREFAGAVSRPVANSLTYDVYRLLPNDTDVTVYRRAGMAAINFAFIDNLSHYHSALDDIVHLDRRTVQHHGDNALAMVRHFADISLEPRPGDAVYADVFGIALIHWPVSWTVPLALLFVAIVLTCMAVLLRNGRMRVTGALYGLLAAVLGLAGSLALGVGTGAVLAAVTGRPGSFHAYPQPALIALWLGALAVAIATGMVFARRAGFMALFIAPWLLISLLAFALATRLPGASVVLFIPAAIGTVCVAINTIGAVATHRGAHLRMRPDVVAIVAAVGAGFTMIPLGRLLYSAFLLEVPVAISAVIGIAALPLLPLLAGPPAAARTNRLTLAAIAVLAGTGLGAALVVPGYSETQPRPMNLVYAMDHDAGEARWAVRGRGMTTSSLPRELHDAAAFADTAPAWLPPAGRGPTAPALTADVPRPSLEILSQEVGPDGELRLVSLRIRPARPGSRLTLVAPGAAIARIGGSAVTGVRGFIAGHGTWILHGVPPDGLVVTLEMPDDARRTITAWDFAPGLPASAAPLLEARPVTATPYADGDATFTVARVSWPVAAP